MDVQYTKLLPGDIAKESMKLNFSCADRHSNSYAQLSMKFNKDYAKVRDCIETILERVGIKYDSIAAPIARMYDEKNIRNIKITDIRLVSSSSKEIGCIDRVFIDYEHFDGWNIRKSTVPFGELEMKMEEIENDRFESTVWR